MKKTILLTGATDGIGRETAKMLVEMGHDVLVHGRSPQKLTQLEKELSAIAKGGIIESYMADLSSLIEVEILAKSLSENHSSLDVLINNAGVFGVPKIMTDEGLDARFVVNTIAPYLLTKLLMPLMGSGSRVVNLSSAAQFPVDLQALDGKVELSDGAAYAQTKLALTMWSRHMALTLGEDGPAVIAVNPKSMLGSKIVKEAYGVAGGDLRIGADILCRAALADEFADATGRYFDNDIGQFTQPHSDAMNKQKCDEIVRVIEAVLSNLNIS